MFKKPVRTTLLTATIILCTACTTPPTQYTNLTTTQIKNILNKNIKCETTKEIKAKFAIPGQIHGYDCTVKDDIGYFYRESNDERILNIEQSYINTSTHPHYIIKNKNWTLLIPKELKQNLEHEKNINFIAHIHLDGKYTHETEKPDVQCAQDLAALIPDYVYNGYEIPNTITKELKQIIKQDYDKYKRQAPPTQEEIPDELYETLSNESTRINQYCKTHKTAYSKTQ